MQKEKKNTTSCRKLKRCEIAIHNKEARIRSLCISEMYKKHDPPSPNFHTIFSTSYDNHTICQIISFLKESLLFNISQEEKDHECELIILSYKLRFKYFKKMLDYTTTNRRTIILIPDSTSLPFRSYFFMKRLGIKAHSFKCIVIHFIAITSKELVNIIREGVNLEYLDLRKCIIEGPKLTFKANGTSRLKKINISWSKTCPVQEFVNFCESDIKLCTAKAKSRCKLIKNSYNSCYFKLEF
ncbi:unnamed protein product [Moneuplotes crassus]|uniref:Uncharacterized protein n=1 Tax=Euplotes crassus TaxID=5936 RepID=A0AAD1UDY8_EUPCR|nr:unnamed protein product [Moneuplotes crassus]